MELLRGALGSREDQALEIALALAMVRRVSGGASGPVIRVYRPRAPVVAFGRRDALRPGFAEAVKAAREAGFTPVVRPQGGRAVAYTSRSLIVDHVSPHPGLAAGMDERFTTYGELWAAVLRRHGVDARVGAVPGEYCPGAYSVNARGRAKLVGTAQRVVRRAWLFSAVAIFDDTDILRPLLRVLYRILDLPFDASSVGSVRAEAPDLSLDRLEAAIIAAYGDRFDLTPATVDGDLLAAARDLADDPQTRGAKM